MVSRMKRSNNVPIGVVDKELYEAIREQEKIMYCDDCKAEWPYHKTEIITQSAKNIQDNTVYTIKYFDCPHCARRYVISVDDENTMAMLSIVRDMEKKIDKYAKRNKYNFDNRKTSFVFDMMIRQRKVALEDVIEEQNKLKELYTKLEADGLLVLV